MLRWITIMITRKTMPAVGVLALLVASPLASAQTMTVAGPFNFVDLLTGPEAGSNSVVTNAATVVTGYQFGSTATVNTINLNVVIAGTYASEANCRMVNSGYPALSASVNFFNTATYTALSIVAPTIRSLTANTLYGSNIAAGTTWDLTFYETFEDGLGPDSTGDTLSMSPDVYVPPPPKTPWAVVAGNTLPIIYDNGTVVNAAGQGAGGLDASTYAANGTTFGFASYAPTFQLADDFVVPSGATWTVTGVSGFAYQTGALALPFGSALVEIWNGDPSAPTSSVIATSTTLGDAVFSNTYRVGPTTLTATNRMIWRIQSLFSGLTLTAGTYWVTYQMNLSTGTTCFTPYVTLDSNQPAGVYPGNAIQRTVVGPPATWAALADGGTPCEVPFLVHGSVATSGQTLSGNLILGDTAFSGASTRNIAWSVMQGTTNLGSGTIVAGAPSTAMNLAVGAGTGAAQLVLDGSSFLKRVVSINLTGSNQAIGNATMQNGDVDNSGEVDAADIDQVISAFGNMGDNVEDVDVSDEVDAADIDIVIANFGGMDD